MTICNIFDVYKCCDAELIDMKSIAFSVKIQPRQKLLTHSDIQDISDNIINIIKQKIGGRLRGTE